MPTFGQWLDDYDGDDNIVAGVATIWSNARGERPRVSAVQSITGWLGEHRRVHDESLRAAVRAFNESRGGRQATDAEVGAFRAMNEPGTIAPVPGDHEQPSPAVMAALGRIERNVASLAGSLEKLTAGFLGPLEGRIDALLAWTETQDERIKPITDLLGELAEAEQAPDQPELDGQGDPDMAAADYAAETGPPFPIRQEGEMGSLWAQIAAPEPDPERMAQLGDPRLVDPD